MFSIEKCPVPANTMLDKYSMNGAYMDCYWTDAPGHIPLSEFIYAFYTTPLFKLERLILWLTASKPSTDQGARQLADGVSDQFAAWHVEHRSENEIVMCDFLKRTRSWLMAKPANRAKNIRTELFFGTAIAPRMNPKSGELSIGIGFQALLGFHKLYSRLLLYSARLRITYLPEKASD